MAEIYYDLVVSRQITIDEVPPAWRKKVQELINERQPFGPTETVVENSKSESNQIAHRA